MGEYEKVACIHVIGILFTFTLKSNLMQGAIGEVGLVAQMAEDKIDLEIGKFRFFLFSFFLLLLYNNLTF